MAEKAAASEEAQAAAEQVAQELAESEFSELCAPYLPNRRTNQSHSFVFSTDLTLSLTITLNVRPQQMLQQWKMGQRKPLLLLKQKLQ